MKMRLLFISVIAALCFSCSPVEDKTYNEQGLSFTYPGNWSVTDETYSDYNYIAVEKIGSKSSGIVTFSWIKNDPNLSPEVFLNITAEALQEKFPANSEFQPVSAETYGKYQVLSIPYSFSILNMPHSGTLYAMETEQWLICICVQGADKDAGTNKAGFELIESTFAIE